MLEANQVDEEHPYHRYIEAHRQPEFGTLDSCRRTDAALSGDQAGRLRRRRALSGAGAGLWRSACAIRAAPLGRTLGPVRSGTGAARFRRVHARQSRQRAPRRGLRIPHPSTDGRSGSRRSDGRHPLVDQTALRRRHAYRRIRLELRRLHELDAAGAAFQRDCGRRLGGAGQRLAALRHPLHRALHGRSARPTRPRTTRAPCSPTWVA